MKYLRIGGTWLLQLLLAVAMIGPGQDKFRSPSWERMFRIWGYPDGFYLVIGAVEVVFGIGLLIPKFASVSAMILAVVMAGAAFTQIFRSTDGRSGVGECVFMTLLLVIAALRWRDRLRLRRRAAAATAPGAGGV